MRPGACVGYVRAARTSLPRFDVPEAQGGLSLAPSSHLNDGNVYAETVPAAASGQLLLDFLSCRYTHSSREAWSAHGKAGRICLDAVPVSPDTVLRAGQLLEYHRPPWREPPAPRWLWPLLDDKHVLVLLKPSGLPVLP